ncbi:MAG: hypothetical protein RMM53_11820, partial [Bacteroidia bacterium]|nr:hypothetical protein [Bacteroidia bacterium]MDW8334894.1 hypothetical protein [Bacteroidia bacterium]
KWVELQQLTARTVLSTPECFAERPIYEEIIAWCGDRGGKFELRRRQAEIALVNYYLEWLKIGGSADDERLRDLAQNLESEARSYLEKTASQPEYHIPFRRSLAHYYLQNGKPNEAIAELKAAMELLPQHPLYSDTDTADFNLEIGLILANHKKYSAALKYLEPALDAYRRAGEAFEIHALQAEALIDECRERL